MGIKMPSGAPPDYVNNKALKARTPELLRLSKPIQALSSTPKESMFNFH
jgi:hypothetical protein